MLVITRICPTIPYVHSVESNVGRIEIPAIRSAGTDFVTAWNVMETFATLINRKVLLPSQKTNYIGVEMHFLSVVLADRLRAIRIDDEWYLRRYPDVVAAIRKGLCTDAADHYVLHGFYEHRLPREILVREHWYLDQHEDVRRAVASRDFSSGQHHFEEVGFREGRLPYDNFSLNGVA